MVDELRSTTGVDAMAHSLPLATSRLFFNLFLVVLVLCRDVFLVLNSIVGCIFLIVFLYGLRVLLLFRRFLGRRLVLGCALLGLILAAALVLVATIER